MGKSFVAIGIKFSWIATIHLKYYWTLSWRRSLSYRNQSIDLQTKSRDWYLYDRNLRHKELSGFIDLRGLLSKILRTETNANGYVSINLKWFLEWYSQDQIYSWKYGKLFYRISSKDAGHQLMLFWYCSAIFWYSSSASLLK